MTPQQIETAARRLLNAESSLFWSQTEVLGDLLYMAATEMATESKCIENRYTTDSVASQAEYQKPTRAFEIKRVTYDGKKLKPIDARRLDAIDDNRNTTVTGEPMYYVDFDDVFKLHPAPDTSSKTIKVWTYDTPSAITVTSTLEIPTRYHPKLVIGTAYYMSFKEIGHPNIDRFGQLWLKALEDVVEAEQKRRRADGFQRVITEEELPTTLLGVV